MNNLKVLVRHGSTPPTEDDLGLWQLGWDQTDNKMYIKDESGISLITGDGENKVIYSVDRDGLFLEVENGKQFPFVVSNSKGEILCNFTLTFGYSLISGAYFTCTAAPHSNGLKPSRGGLIKHTLSGDHTSILTDTVESSTLSFSQTGKARIELWFKDNREALIIDNLVLSKNPDGYDSLSRSYPLLWQAEFKYYSFGGK